MNNLIHAAKEQVQLATHPVAKALHKGANSKVLVIAFKKGMSLPNHQTPTPATLLVLEGEAQYEQQNVCINLLPYEYTPIEPNITHAVTALTDCLCLLIQG